jgi:hypothetical protein
MGAEETSSASMASDAKDFLYSNREAVLKSEACKNFLRGNIDNWFTVTSG